MQDRTSAPSGSSLKLAFFRRTGGFLFPDGWLLQNGSVALLHRIMHVADLVEMAGVDDTGYVVGDGGDKGLETK